MNFKSKHVSITRRNEDTYHSVLSTDRSIKLLAEKTVDVSFWTMPAKVQKCKRKDLSLGIKDLSTA